VPKKKQRRKGLPGGTEYLLAHIRLLLNLPRRGVTAEEAAGEVGCAVRTSYRHLATLRRAGLLEPGRHGRYVFLRTPTKPVRPEPKKRTKKAVAKKAVAKKKPARKPPAARRGRPAKKR
jgi:predicted DNA-binding transcriptional regulator YafY